MRKKTKMNKLENRNIQSIKSENWLFKENQ